MNDHTKDRHAALAEVIQFQARNDLHRVFPECAEDRREPMTGLERAGRAIAFIAAACIVIGLVCWGCQELSRVDWSAVAQITGKPS